MALGILDNDDSILTCMSTWIMLILGISTNILALHLAVKHSHHNIGKYRYILYCFLVHNMIFTLVNALADWASELN
ncbi:unnamed protein product, partial [Mesorhabditis belari]|uniref:Uncharacterized protein n=1 Tax=Mesorhabditis belari TaxID=2138241 RepID=A0AAF3EVT5_9BILA